MFGIQSQDRKVFNNNFLRTVFFEVKYSLTDQNLEKIEEKLKAKFGNEFFIQKSNIGFGFNLKIQNGKKTIEPDNDGEAIGLIIKSFDGKKTINLDENSIKISIQGSAYTSFDNNINLIEKFITEINEFISSVNRILIRKINIVEFERTEEAEEAPLFLLNYLINNNLVGGFASFNPETTLNQMSSLSLLENKYFLNLKYGLNSPNNILEDNTKHIILDIEHGNSNNINRDNILEEFSILNKNIFDIFMWSITDEFKSILDKQNVEL